MQTTHRKEVNLVVYCDSENDLVVKKKARDR